jgi:hypothetical protein
MLSFLKLSLLAQALAFPHLLRVKESDQKKLPLRRNLQTTEEVIDLVKDDVAALVNNNEELAAKFVRLVFHDCVGGCNGCVDVANVSFSYFSC